MTDIGYKGRLGSKEVEVTRKSKRLTEKNYQRKCQGCFGRKDLEETITDHKRDYQCGIGR